MAHQIHLSVVPNTSREKETSSSAVDQTSVLLFVGSVDSKIYIRSTTIESILTSPECSGLFSLSGMLYGHEDWVTSLDSILTAEGALFVASSSQDAKIRLWRIETSQAKLSSNDDKLQSFNVDDAGDDDENDEDEVEDVGESGNSGNAEPKLDEEDELTEARVVFATKYQSHAVFLDALLVGHEDWVTSVHWRVKYSARDRLSSLTGNDGNSALPATQDLGLFTTSMDRNMVVWEPEPISGVWVPIVRVGDIGGLLGGSVGANLLGFVGGCLDPQGDSLLGVGYGGSFHLWSTSGARWQPVPFLSGHFGHVSDIVWAGRGEYLVSASSDQTCRIFAPMTRSQHATAMEDETRWCEVSRPQVHGYDLSSLLLLPYSGLGGTDVKANPNPFLLLTAADEKLIRMFDAPECVVSGIRTLCGVDYTAGGTGTVAPDENVVPDTTNKNRILKAFIPELGLSNKAADLMSSQEISEQTARNVASLDWTQAPLESQLADHTIWPEIKKMFGHNNDVVKIAVSPDGKWIASSAKAKDRKAANILIWETTNFTCVDRLDSHESTVVSLEFSPNSRYLASAGKDRALCLHAVNEVSSEALQEHRGKVFELVAGVKSAHKRIIWSCSWSSDSRLLVTGSRDGSCKVWAVSESAEEASGSVSLNISLVCKQTFSPFGGEAVTAVSVGPLLQLSDGDASAESGPAWLLATGGEGGGISLWGLSVGSAGSAGSAGAGPSAALLQQAESHCAHGMAVKKLLWSPLPLPRGSDTGDSETASHGDAWRLASCSEDHTIRIHRVALQHQNRK
jgi:elongator complex protein 2